MSISRYRAGQRRLAIQLTRPRRIPPLRRMVIVGSILGWEVVNWKLREAGKPDSRKKLSVRLRKAAERLGPTYIKLAQIISAGQGVFPDELVEQCKLCRDSVPGVPFAKVREIVEQATHGDMFDSFAEFSPTPLAAASIAQVHGATLANGKEVVVKVQRPNIEKLVRQDLAVMSTFAPFLVGRIKIAALANPPALVELFAETISEELDFRLEAENMQDIRNSLLELDRGEFILPTPVSEHTYKRVLVMNRLDGIDFSNPEALRANNVDTEKAIRDLLLGFLEGAFLKGVFHGDLHSGNLKILSNGQIGLMDFGITGRLSDRERTGFLKMLFAATTNNPNGQVEALVDLGALPDDTNVADMVSELGLDKQIDPTQFSQQELVREIRKLLKGLLFYGAKLPKPLMLYAKNLIFIENSIAELAPQLDLFELVNSVSMHFASEHGAAITKELGVKESDWELDLDGIKASFWVNPNDRESLTYAELLERRKLIKSRLGNDFTID